MDWIAVTAASSFRSPLSRIASGLVDLVFPPRCAACGHYGDDQSRPLCLSCAEAVSRERFALSCPICAANVAPYEVSWDGCRECRETRKRIGGTARVAAYRTTVGAMLRQYKYHHREDLEPLLSTWLADVLTEARWLERVEAVVAVPTHWRRAFNRRFHAADALARAVARRLELPLAPVLRRTRSGPRQVELSPEDRRKNVRGAFALRPGARLHNARLLLIDDVRTTGATLEECARVLRRAGAKEIYAAVITRANWLPTATDLDPWA